MRRFVRSLGIGLLLGVSAAVGESYHPSNAIPIWPDGAPGEISQNTGELQPFRPNENPPVLRVEKISQPLLQVFPSTKRPTRAGVLILPGGGYGKVVTNKEGSEAALWLNELGITAFVLSYRTSASSEARPWFRPLQDSQRALRMIRHRAKEWNIAPHKIGLLGFSAGGQLAAIHIGDQFPNAYDLKDPIDTVSHTPDFALLIYPWNVFDTQTGSLKPETSPNTKAPPTFLVHTDDDRSTSLGALGIYTQLKSLGVSAELHVFHNGGHGYGMRTVPGSDVDTWTDLAGAWLFRLGVGSPRRD